MNREFYRTPNNRLSFFSFDSVPEKIPRISRRSDGSQRERLYVKQLALGIEAYVLSSRRIWTLGGESAAAGDTARPKERAYIKPAYIYGVGHRAQQYDNLAAADTGSHDVPTLPLHPFGVDSPASTLSRSLRFPVASI